MTLHDAQKLNDDLGGRADEHLTFATTFGIDDVVQAVVLMTKSGLLEMQKKEIQVELTRTETRTMLSFWGWCRRKATEKRWGEYKQRFQSPE